jgi:hypothetical protein
MTCKLIANMAMNLLANLLGVDLVSAVSLVSVVSKV